MLRQLSVRFLQDTRMVKTRILIVEPFEEIRRMVEATLASRGYLPMVVEDGAAAVDAIQSQRFDCVVIGSPVGVDIGGDTIFLLQYLQWHCQDIRPCLIVTTAYIESESLLSLAARIPACAVLGKPFEASDLLAAVEACLSGSHKGTRWIGVPDSIVAAVAEST
jgi:DNA-binding response OmpR family regulator